MSLWDRIKSFGTSAVSQDRCLPTQIAADTSEIDVSAWSFEVINSLSSEYASIARPYRDNPIVRAAIEAMRRNATKATLQVGRFDSDGGFEPVDHPLTAIWSDPSPGETDGSLIEFAYQSLIDDVGDGNAYVEMIENRSGGSEIVELQPIPPLWIPYPEPGLAVGEVLTYPVHGSDWTRSWNYDVPADRMVHLKMGRSVATMVKGRSPLQSVVPELALVKLISVYETTILQRAGVPSWIIQLIGTASAGLSRQQINVLQEDFKRAASGKAVGRPFVHKGDMKLDTPGFSPKELSVAEMAEIAVCRICGVLGWAPMSLKQPDTGKTYSNLIEANKASWRDAVLPYLEMWAASLTKGVRRRGWAYGDMRAGADPTLSVRFDVSQIEELAADADKIAERSVRLYSAGVITLEEARTMNGLSGAPDELAAKDEPEDYENRPERGQDGSA